MEYERRFRPSGNSKGEQVSHVSLLDDFDAPLSGDRDIEAITGKRVADETGQRMKTTFREVDLSDPKTVIDSYEDDG